MGGKASALGRTNGGGPVDAAKAIANFMGAGAGAATGAATGASTAAAGGKAGKAGAGASAAGAAAKRQREYLPLPLTHPS